MHWDAGQLLARVLEARHLLVQVVVVARAQVSQLFEFLLNLGVGRVLQMQAASSEVSHLAFQVANLLSRQLARFGQESGALIGKKGLIQVLPKVRLDRERVNIFLHFHSNIAQFFRRIEVVDEADQTLLRFRNAARLNQRIDGVLKISLACHRHNALNRIIHNLLHVDSNFIQSINCNICKLVPRFCDLHFTL
jgi:hypothetical protein